VRPQVVVVVLKFGIGDVDFAEFDVRRFRRPCPQLELGDYQRPVADVFDVVADDVPEFVQRNRARVLRVVSRRRRRLGLLTEPSDGVTVTFFHLYQAVVGQVVQQAAKPHLPVVAVRRVVDTDFRP